MFEYIEFVICFGERVEPEWLLSGTQEGALVYARQLIFYFAVKYKLGTYTDLGKKYGKDHATVSHSIKSIKNYLDTDRVKKHRIDYYGKIFEKLNRLVTKKDNIDKMIKPLMTEISELEGRIINLTLQLQFLKEEFTKINDYENQDQGGPRLLRVTNGKSDDAAEISAIGVR